MLGNYKWGDIMMAGHKIDVLFDVVVVTHRNPGDFTVQFCGRL